MTRPAATSILLPMEQSTENPSIETRQKILAASLSHIPFDGWTVKSLKLAIIDVGLPIGADELYFPGGVLELISFWSQQRDQAALKKVKTLDLDSLRIRDKITECVWFRLEQMRGEEEVARRAMSRLLVPDALGKAPKYIWGSADLIWRSIGDKSTDGNYYSKRTILSGVITSSIMAWLADDTEDKSKARAFLEARIENVMQFEKAKFSFRKRQATMPEPSELFSRLRYRRRRRRYR